MALGYWQAKIWGLLHDPVLKALSDRFDFNREGQWTLLQCMQGWKSPKDKSAMKDLTLNRNWLDHIGLCDLISSASDRSTIGRLPPEYSAVSYRENLKIHHLLSGESQSLQVNPSWQQQINQKNRRQFLETKEAEFLEEISQWEDAEKVFWALWRCYPEVLEKEEPLVHLLPAETRLPDGSLWSHVSMTSALAGGLAGYYKNPEHYPSKGQTFNNYSRPYLVTFTFTPVQELVKSSRKMRDFWAGSWILHYLSAKVSWEIACKYGADTILYPCLYQQPLIDYWLLKKYQEDFKNKEWIKEPKLESLLTSGFPNVIVMILPNNSKSKDDSKDNPIYAATQLAKQTLKQEWRKLGHKVLNFLQTNSEQSRKDWENINPNTWDSWLEAQWQTYWTAFPIGDPETNLTCSPRNEEKFEDWIDRQNELINPKDSLFENSEEQFLKNIFNLTDSEENEGNKTKYSKQPNLNIGSWWGYIFDQLRSSLTTVKNARDWESPTAFTSRSSVSGLGSAVHPIYDIDKPDWAKEKQVKDFWENQFGLFNGSEKLNATEVVKRVLHKIILEELTGETQNDNPILYPDLSSGVAGYLRQMERDKNTEALKYYRNKCQHIVNKFEWTNKAEKEPWGIPWIDKKYPQYPNPRLFNTGWLIEDYPEKNLESKKDELKQLKKEINQIYSPGSNPTDWYVLAAGDGDNMNHWLKGSNLEAYRQYIPDELKQKIDTANAIPEKYQKPLQQFLEVKKRMGPSTHSALSRALLDFSNQLVPYLTEQRYAGRLIYGGGDDVLAYTNLWEWDKWLWDIRQCFKGKKDPHGEFNNAGDYWQWEGEKPAENLAKRPLFTMGKRATISFGIVIAHHSVPLAIALENLWEAEKKAKEHAYKDFDGKKVKKDAVQVRVLYGNGNILKSTAKFDVFYQWQQLLAGNSDASLFEAVAGLWQQHPIPMIEAIEVWVKAFSSRRENLTTENREAFQKDLSNFLKHLWLTTENDPNDLNEAVRSWMKLAAFMTRKREIKIGGSI
jgi:CRISPR-associated protein Cmr2